MEVEHFTDWGLEIRQDAYDEGLADGKAEGKAEGMAMAVVRITEKIGCSIDEAFDIVNIPDNMKDVVFRLVNELLNN